MGKIVTKYFHFIIFLLCKFVGFAIAWILSQILHWLADKLADWIAGIRFSFSLCSRLDSYEHHSISFHCPHSLLAAVWGGWQWVPDGWNRMKRSPEAEQERDRELIRFPGIWKGFTRIWLMEILIWIIHFQIRRYHQIQSSKYSLLWA